MATRNYIRDITTATTGASIQIQRKGRIKVITINAVNAAAGTIDVSLSQTSQVATAAPDTSVIARCQGGITPFAFFKTEMDLPVEPFQLLYLHEAGAGNGGTVTVVVAES